MMRWPVFSGWWCLDDWGQLAAGAGWPEAGGSGLRARLFSQVWWWQLTWPVLGLNHAAHAVLRLLLHGLAALLVYRIASGARLVRPAALLAAAFFAASPVAFTPLYWASGIQELLGGFCALLCVERWFLGRSRSALIAAGLAGCLAMLAKEAGLGLGLFLSLALLRGGNVRREPLRWLVVAVLLLVAVGESWLVLQHFDTAADRPYATGGGPTLLRNVGLLGWYLIPASPVFSSQPASWQMALGWGLFLVWAAWGIRQWRRRPTPASAGCAVLPELPLAALVLGLLSLAPALPLRHQWHPYLAYLAVAPLAVTLAALVPGRLAGNRLFVPLVAMLAVVWSVGGMQLRLGQNSENGLPADPVVRAGVHSRRAAGILGDVAPGQPVVFFQPPVSREDRRRMEKRGPALVRRTPRHAAVQGNLGPRLVLGREGDVSWLNLLVEVPAGACIIAETPEGFRDWGTTDEALQYAIMLDLGLGHFDRARRHLLRAADLDPGFGRAPYDPRRSPLPRKLFARGCARFEAWLAGREEDGALSPAEVAVLSGLFRDFQRKIRSGDS